MCIYNYIYILYVYITYIIMCAHTYITTIKEKAMTLKESRESTREELAERKGKGK